MPYCSQCGVEVDKSVDYCPLCGLPIQKFDHSPGEERAYPERFRFDTISARQKRLIVWIVLTSLHTASFLVVLSVNLIITGRITWASYAMAGIGVSWMYWTLIIFFIKRFVVVIIGNFLVSTGFLVLIDVFDGSMDWFLALGLPTAAMVAGTTMLIALASRLLRNRPALLWSFVFFLAGVFCIGLDLLISGYRSTVHLSWSFIIMGSLYPLSLMLVIYHVFIRKRIDLERIFHV